MDYKINKSHKSDILKLSLQQNETFNSRAKSVSTYGGSLNISTGTTRSLWKALDSRENFPLTELSVNDEQGIATLVPPYPGEIEHIDLDRDMKVQTLSYLGSSENVNVDLNVDDVYTNESLGTLEIKSDGDSDNLFISGYGGIEIIELEDNQQTNVRQDYLIAFDRSVDYTRRKKAGLKSKALGASDKPMIKMTGPGCIYTQIRSPVKNEEIFDKLD